MLGMALLNIILGGVIGLRYRVMIIAPLSAVTAFEGLLCGMPPRNWMTVAWQGGVLVLCLAIGYLAGSAYGVYRIDLRSADPSHLEISTLTEMSRQ